jgi:hypothetical protein
VLLYKLLFEAPLLCSYIKAPLEPRLGFLDDFCKSRIVPTYSYRNAIQRWGNNICWVYSLTINQRYSSKHWLPSVALKRCLKLLDQLQRDLEDDELSVICYPILLCT